MSRHAMKKIGQVLFVGLLAAISIYAADPGMGTWKLNAAKSKNTATNPVKSRTDKLEAAADGSIKFSRTETRADGTTYTGGGSFKMDGKEYPMTGLQWDTITAKRLTNNSYETVTKKKGGKWNQTTVNSFSADGKVKTQTTKGTDAEGKPVEATMIYDLQ